MTPSYLQPVLLLVLLATLLGRHGELAVVVGIALLLLLLMPVATQGTSEGVPARHSPSRRMLSECHIQWKRSSKVATWPTHLASEVQMPP